MTRPAAALSWRSLDDLPRTLVVSAAGAAAVLGVMFKGHEGGALRAIEALATLAVLTVAVRWPVPTLCFLVAYLPVQVPLLASLYQHGVPAGVVRGAGGVKEVVTAAMLVVALASKRRRRGRDAIDVLALIVIGIATLYLVLPMLAPGLLGGLPLNVRALAWRIEALFLVFLLLTRRISFSDSERSWIVRSVCVVGVVLVGVGTYEWLNPHSYNNWLEHQGVARYYSSILHSPLRNPAQLVNFRSLGDAHPRSGSLLLSAMAFCWYSLILCAIGLERVARGRFSWVAVVLAGAGALGVIETGTRAALVGLIFMVAATVGYASPRYSRRRIRLALLLMVAGIAFTPVLTSTDIVQRFVGAVNGTEVSAQEHRQALSSGYADVLRQPFGKGLGSDPAVGTRFDTEIASTPESSYLQVGIELGAPAMVAFAALLAAIAVASRRRAADRRARNPEAATVFAVTVGLAVGGLFLHVWLSFAVSMTFALLAALALPSPHRVVDPAVDDSQ